MTGMDWLLVIFLLVPGKGLVQTPLGLINGIDLCHITGRALVEQSAREAPENRMAFICVRQVAV